jgi:hypothetical protein
MCIVTYEYQCRIQIFVVLLHEVLIIFIGLFAIAFVELATEILLRQLPNLFLSVRGVNDGGLRDAKLSLPIRWAFVWFPVSIPPQYPPMILAASRDQKVVVLSFR